MSRKPEKKEENMRGSGKIIAYIVVASVIAIVIISYCIIANIISNNQEEQRLAEIKSEEKQLDEQEMTSKDNEKTESVSTQIGKTIKESSEKNENKNIIDNVNTEETEKNTQNIVDKAESKESITKNETLDKTTKEINFTMPIEGEIVRGFAKDNLVYSETLQEWITHQAIDIKANSRDVIKAAAPGKVTAIKNDPRYGLTIIIEHDNGFKTIYSNLLTAEFVVEGEQVKQGQTLGTIGSSATFEIADEPHLHFEMMKDSEYVDPTIYIK